MRRSCQVIFAVASAVGLTLISSPLQSDVNPMSCEIDVECIDRIPFYQPLVLVNPVVGCNEKSILSIWGDDRDNGKRKHQGIDIIAPKGTDVIAPIEGVVTRTGWNALGGKVVWIESRRAQHAFYLAHLATIDVCVGDQVQQGDRLGTVGNTGNARFTAPHLHFGIYARDRKTPMNREVVWTTQKVPESELQTPYTHSDE